MSGRSKVKTELSERVEGLLANEIRESQEALRGSVVNLPPLAAHVQASYREALNDDAARRESFRQAKVVSATMRSVTSRY